MASKMLNAKDADERCITLGMGEQQQYRKPLRCEFCEAAVTFVNGFFRNIGEDRVAVDPYFRLFPEQKHAITCAHNVYGQISVIAKKSDPNIVAAIKNNRYELRLLVVQQALSRLRDLAKKKHDKKPMVSGKTTDKEYMEAEERLGGYINSAARVLKVRAACLDHAEIEDVLQLVFDGVRVPWRDFFFEDNDYFRCFSQVRQATVNVPIAVQGTIKDINPVLGKFKVINLMAPIRKTDRPDVLDAASFSIWSVDLEAFGSYAPGQEIIAFGQWGNTRIKENLNKKENAVIKVFRNHELRLWPVTKSQLCAVTG